VKKYIALLGILLFILAACGVKGSIATPVDVPALQTASVQTVVAWANKTATANAPATHTPQLRINYTLIDKELGSSKKCILDIRLPDRISEDEIKAIAEHLRDNEGESCSPLFIFYFLPGEIPGTDMAWAYSHYNPQLEIQINGLSLKTKATLEADKTSDDENVVGSWLDAGSISRKIVIKKINNSYRMTSTYGDGSGETVTLTVKVVNGEERLYETPGNLYGDYMVIKENGNLAFFDDAGFIYELLPD